MKFCCYCGTQISDDARFCYNCGKVVVDYRSGEDTGESTVNTEPEGSGEYVHIPDFTRRNEGQQLLASLSSRLRLNAIIWFIVAGVQIILGVCGAYFTLVIAVLNIISAVTDLNNSKKILENPCGIVKTYEPIVSGIITLVYNVVVGGVVGVAGSIYYLVGVRGFVMKNKQEFLTMEANYSE